MQRRILHVDMDAFYASVEQADRPELKGLPVIVGSGARGVVAAASYEARRFGVRSAMPVFQARRLCPKGVFLPVRMGRYQDFSALIMGILARYSPLVEPVSIDEAFLDITGMDSLHGSPPELARSVKATIAEETSLTCSIGIGPNKFLAKIASELDKPDGLIMIEEHQVADFMRTLPIERIPGVGPKTAMLLKDLGVGVASDLLRWPPAFWRKRLGRSGERLYEKAQGVDGSPVVPFGEPKSCSAEDTFDRDTSDLEELQRWLLRQAESVGRELREKGYRGRTITLKVKFADFLLITRSRTLREPTHATRVLFDAAAELLGGLRLVKEVRLIGLGVSNLSAGPRQGSLFAEGGALKSEQLDRAMDAIADKYGDRALQRGRLFKS